VAAAVRTHACRQSGMLTLFIRAVMCTWMVSTGVVAAMMSTSVPGKIMAMWMPILVFFYLGFKHSIVNMFLFPSGLLMGGDFTWGDYIFWNELPTGPARRARPGAALDEPRHHARGTRRRLVSQARLRRLMASDAGAAHPSRPANVG
jgi:hypothetical protein